MSELRVRYRGTFGEAALLKLCGHAGGPARTAKVYVSHEAYREYVVAVSKDCRFVPTPDALAPPADDPDPGSVRVFYEDGSMVSLGVDFDLSPRAARVVLK